MKKIGKSLFLFSAFMLFGLVLNAQTTCNSAANKTKECAAKKCSPEQCKKMVDLGLCTKEEAAKCIKKCNSAQVNSCSKTVSNKSKMTKVASASMDKSNTGKSSKKCCATKSTCAKSKE